MNNKTETIRVRIAPSPTGNLHVGTARAALFNELFAKQNNGKFVLRLEDTDKVRSKLEYENNILEALTWLGLTWHEGPNVGGPHKPYRQSERTVLYEEAILKLLETDKAYYCYCPPKTNEKEVLTCNCRKTPKTGDHSKHIIKLNIDPQIITFQDIVRGEVTVHTDSFGGDFIIARTIKDPLFHLAVVVDDATMNITHVIRGEDHISNTAKHILLQRALGYTQPQYAHIPLLLDEQRKKLSKRRGETSVLAYKESGYLPEAMLNYLALLGWNPKDDREYFTHEELINTFSLTDVQKGGAIFSIEKLNSINKHYIRLLNPEDLYNRALPFLKSANIDVTDKNLIMKAIQTEQERISTLSELPEKIKFFLPTWEGDYVAELLIWKKSDSATTSDIISKLIQKIANISEENFTEKELEEELMSWIDNNDLGRGDTLWPMRVALTGQKNSPGPFEVVSILGKEITLFRLEQALAKLN